MYDALYKLKFSKSYNLCDTFLDFENFSFGTYNIWEQRTIFMEHASVDLVYTNI